LSTLEERRVEVCENAEKAQIELKEMYKKALSRLHVVTQTKLSDLLSDEAELRRRLEEIEWMNRFINYQKESVTPVNFLDSFQQHNLLKRDKIGGMEESLHCIADSMQRVLPDIETTGDFEVNSPSQPIDQHPELRLVDIHDPDRGVVDDESELNANAGIHIDDEALLLKQNQECIIS
jgi:hypothetical protein